MQVPKSYSMQRKGGSLNTWTELLKHFSVIFITKLVSKLLSTGVTSFFSTYTEII